MTADSQRLADLLRQISCHDHAAFRQLYDLTSRCLYGVIVRLVRKAELADEILQETYINVWQQAGTYVAGISAPMTWLISIARNKSLDRLRKGKLELESCPAPSCEARDADDEGPAEAVSELQLYLEAIERGALQRCLSLLDPSHRQSIMLAYYHGLSHGELAAHMRVPLGTAKAWVRRGLRDLRACCR